MAISYGEQATVVLGKPGVGNAMSRFAFEEDLIFGVRSQMYPLRRCNEQAMLHRHFKRERHH